jgi:hypothetical protein
MTGGERIAVGDVARLDIPHRGVVVGVQQRLIIADCYVIPGTELLWFRQPAQEVVCFFLLGGEIEDRMADRAKKMEATLGSGRVQRLLGDLADVGKILLCKP